LAWLLVLGTCAGAHAQGSSTRPGSGADEDAAVRNDDATVGAPPFLVAGVVIAPARRSAMLVVLDDARREIGVVNVREGESYGGYRVAKVEPERVLFERNGTVSPVIVGRPYAGPRGAGDAPQRPRFFFVPGPDKPTPEIPYLGPQVDRGGGPSAPSAVSDAPSANDPDTEVIQKFLERVFSDPELQQNLRKMPSPLRGPQQDRLPDVPAAAANAPPTAPR
jgi:hypothetical protein